MIDLYIAAFCDMIRFMNICKKPKKTKPAGPDVVLPRTLMGFYYKNFGGWHR
jgi:hypothetical protein